MRQLSDIALVAQVLVLHNKRAFDSLVMKYQSSVRRFFLNQTLGDKELSDDLAQETFIRAYLRLDSFKGLSSFSTWLFRIAYNVLYDDVRSRKPTDSLQTDEVDRTQQTEQTDTAVKLDIYNALRQLKEEERICLTLFYMEDLSIDKIAAITGKPAGTVKSHLARGKEKMHEYLTRNGYEGKE